MLHLLNADTVPVDTASIANTSPPVDATTFCVSTVELLEKPTIDVLAPSCTCL